MEFKTNLLEHQFNAVKKLQGIKVGALFMDLGTGKTRTALELIKIRLDKGKIDKVLWLCPCSVKENLRQDIIKHVGDIPKFIEICGIETLSSSIKENFRLLDLVQNNKVYLIVDESNLIKNHKAKRTQNIIRLAEYCKYKLILNGTPITRNEADLYSQFYILSWKILGYKSYWSFSANHIELDEYGRLRKCLNIDYLVKKIAPYSYQIKKEECVKLPEKTYETIYYELTCEQYEHYLGVGNQLALELDEWEPWTIYRMFSALQDVISGLFVDTSKDNIITHNFFTDYKDNPRMECLFNLVDGLEEKAIIFCKYQFEVDNIIDYLGDKAVEFTGNVNQKTRQKNLKAFCEDKQFLIANKQCGAYGLNLQFCSYIIFYSNDFDYGTRIQAEDRVHRLGQNKNVCIVDICANDTLDKKIIRCLQKKENLLDSFKLELDEAKDKKYELYSWITKKDFRNKKYNKKIADINKEDLNEDLS